MDDMEKLGRACDANAIPVATPGIEPEMRWSKKAVEAAIQWQEAEAARPKTPMSEVGSMRLDMSVLRAVKEGHRSANLGVTSGRIPSN